MIFGLLRGTNPVEARDVELLHERIVPFELWKEILFDHGVRRARVEQGVSPKDWTHLYVNPTQPLYPKDHPDHAVVNVVIEGQDVGLLYTNELLPVSDVAEYRLLAPPDAWKDALAKLAEHRGRPVELAVDLRKGEQEIYLLFKNPRGIWQLSNFDRRGPVGHAEGKTAASAVKNGLTRRRYDGFKLDPGLLDTWAPAFTFTGNP